MKTTTTMKQTLLALTIALSIVSCKKDKKSDPAPTPQQTITFENLLKLSTGASVKAPDNTKITGIVISDVSNKNIDPKTVVLQEATGKAGIVVTFTAAQTFALGDQVDVNISGQTLAQVNGEVELTNIPAANAKKSGTGTITPAMTNAAAIVKNAAAMDGTLVTIPATGFSGTSANYTGTLTVTDSTGTVSSNVLAGAAFENTAYPVSLSSLTGIVRISGTTVRVDIRGTADAETGAVTRIVTENFINVTGDPNYADPGSPTILNPASLFARPDGFTTAQGPWAQSGTPNGVDLCYLLPGSKYDADFTTKDRSYVYLIRGAESNKTINQLGSVNYGGNSIMNNFTNLAGLKTVSITFAGSKMSGPGVLAGSAQWGFPDLDVLPFNPATDYIQIGVIPVDDQGRGVGTLISDGSVLLTKSAQYTNLGVFYTLTWTVPTKAQLIAAGNSPGVNVDQTAAWLANPNFAIINMSNKAAGDDLVGLQMTPVLIDKVVFGF
jgi:hypothetical protein